MGKKAGESIQPDDIAIFFCEMDRIERHVYKQSRDSLQHNTFSQWEKPGLREGLEIPV